MALAKVRVLGSKALAKTRALSDMLACVHMRGSHTIKANNGVHVHAELAPRLCMRNVLIHGPCMCAMCACSPYVHAMRMH